MGLILSSGFHVCCSHLVFSWSVVALLLVSSSWAEEEVASIEEDTSTELSVGELLERANRDRNPDIDEPTLIGGDIAIKSDADRNADPCTSRGCMWLKWTDGNVYIPYYIANHTPPARRPSSFVDWSLSLQ